MYRLYIVTALITLIQLWWIVAHLYAYRQLRDSRLLFQVFQGIAFGLLFAYVTVALANQLPINLIFGMLLLVIGIGNGFIWRGRDGVTILLENYDSGIVDLMLFRKAHPA